MISKQFLARQNIITFALIVLGVLFLGWLGKLAFESRLGLNKLPEANYISAISGRDVVQGVDGLEGVTRVALTPDEWAMFVTTLDGRVWVLKNLDAFGTDNEGQYVLQENPLYQLPLGWKPGTENGMTGIAVSYDFVIDHYVFVSYARNISGIGRNYIDRLKVEDSANGMRVVETKNIYAGNTSSGVSHQIQALETLAIADKLHVMFSVGDGKDDASAQNLTKEAGKVLMITADGGNPLGSRPFPANPRIQAIGLRNAYGLARDGESDWVYLTDNGPDANDRILYAPILDSDYQIDFGWDGNPDNLLKPKVNGAITPDLIVKNWDKPVAPTDIVVDSLGRFYFNIFSSANYPYKEVWMGERGRNDVVKLTKIVERNPKNVGGNLLGLTISDLTGNIWFGDIGDGGLYVLGRSWELVRVLGK